MYRIRRETGEEVNFGSIDELGAAVASGVVTAKAEIFHARAEKWLPIASHPHFKMAHDRINSATAPKASSPRPALSASGQRPAITVPQASAPTAAPSTTASRVQAPQLRVMRADAPAASAPATTETAAAQKPAPRWNSAQRPAARAVAQKPPAPSAPPAGDLRLVRADIRLNGAATAPELPEVEFELLPEIEEPAVIQPVATPAVVVEQTLAEPVVAEPAAIEAVPVEPVAYEPPVVERSPASVELVSHEQQPSSRRGEVEIINPDRSMPVVNDREVPALEIPAPIQDFTPADAAATPAARTSKAPLFIGLGLVAAVAAGIGFFVFKPSSAAPSTPNSTVSAAKPAPVSAAPVTSQPAPAPVVAPAPPTGASTGLGGDVQPRKPKAKASDDAKATVGDGLEPPPEDVMPAAPTIGKLGDDAALPTVDAGGASLKMVDRANALERQRRLIDSSMKR
jgi:hypothetical protein